MDGDVAHFCRKGQFLILLIKRQVVINILRQVITVLLIAVVVARFHLGGVDGDIPVHVAMVVSVSVTIRGQVPVAAPFSHSSCHDRQDVSVKVDTPLHTWLSGYACCFPGFPHTL